MIRNYDDKLYQFESTFVIFSIMGMKVYDKFYIISPLFLHVKGTRTFIPARKTQSITNVCDYEFWFRLVLEEAKQIPNKYFPHAPR